ncbi:Ulp1 protease family, C-terminal catalytic domain-containing protein [Babesia caballi]|uniref:Ulp1 protease family, C-terminal catalytic domain-containing protein n=1 Tax=Babesia caballi TaxID=5871 RepID=A0AAV4LYW9_BABCB|nr:Ulp1 protease family, C-terminal catalytic domain-containing protein [Babesia caballi]
MDQTSPASSTTSTSSTETVPNASVHRRSSEDNAATPPSRRSSARSSASGRSRTSSPYRDSPPTDDARSYDHLLSGMSKLSIGADGTALAEALATAEAHRLKVERLERKLRSLDELTSTALVEPLPAEGEPGHDLWDLKSREAARTGSTSHLGVLFQNDSADRWLNFHLLGNAEEALKRLRRGSSSEVLADKFGIEMTRKHLACLDGPHWLNDEVINFFIGLVQERNDRLVGDGVAGIPRCFCFNTFFFNMLCGGDNPNASYNYSSVARWTARRKIDVFAVDLLLVPVHAHRNHWCLGVVDMRPPSRRIMMFDSLGGTHKAFFQNIRRWLQDEHLHKRRVPLDAIDDWEYSSSFASERLAPRQHNGHDCGVFLCFYAECLSVARPFDFSQRDMRDRRVRMVQQILRGSIFE